MNHKIRKLCVRDSFALYIFNAYSFITFAVCRQVGDAGVTCLCPKGFKGKKCQIPEDETMIGEYNYSFYVLQIPCTLSQLLTVNVGHN